VSVAVVLVFSGNLSAAQTAADSSEMLAFAETEVERALDIIVARRPRLVIVNQVFAATAPGIALVDRIRHDSALQPCDIRTVPFGEATGPLDMTGTRRAPRFSMAAGITADLDGKTASIVNMSLVGAQVLSETILKPKQRLRFTVVDEGRSIRIQSVVATVAVEIVKGAPRYRAGIEFFNADPAALQKFIDRNKK
jgi:PilZ domain-containing protein